MWFNLVINEMFHKYLLCAILIDVSNVYDQPLKCIITCASSRQAKQLTIRHGNLEVPNLLARLPQRYNWPQYQASGDTEKKIYQNKRYKISPTKRTPSLYKTKNRYNMNTNNKLTIEKINWAQYSRLRNIQQLNQSPKHSHKTAFSPTIQVLDGEDQMITNVKGVGLVVKNSRVNMHQGGNNRVIINQLRENEGMEEKDNIYWQKGEKPRQTHKNNLMQTHKYQTLQTNYFDPSKLSTKEENNYSKASSTTKGLPNHISVIKNQIKGTMGYPKKDNKRRQSLPNNPRWKYRSTPSPTQRLVTWLPKLQEKGKKGSLVVSKSMLIMIMIDKLYKLISCSQPSVFC